MRLPLLIALTLPVLAQCQPVPAGYQKLADLDYVGAGNKRQMLDLYLPETKTTKPRPLVVYIHGGGWEGGSKDQAGVLFNLIKDRPYAGASINYRLTNEATWPAQLHDCKAAIRALRAHAAANQIDPDKIAVFGISAGGHLVSLLGVSGGVKELEGALGKHLDQGSRVTCVLDFCGPSNFLTFGGNGSVIDPDDPKGALAKLIGGPLKDKQSIGRNASPVTYITHDDAPFLLIHGDKDNIVPYAQAIEFDAALDAAKIPATLLTGTNGGHVFFSGPLIEHMRNFLDRHLLGKDVQIPEGAVSSK
ncbi:MAG: alpha/beta hydrolase fold domain-containing protein [Prosthecobacter sp.]|uniref:alpha/beta hydrolase fold domain-containing protein n=1 Tax=Prosthecobacter sp. TaxID=1965333 RepID=UPI0038FD9F3D